MSTVIKVENLSKQYRLGLVGASTFKEDTKRWFAKMRGKEDPFLKLGVENEKSVRDNSSFVWSLKDVSFDVKKGDVLGVIGNNGAGKSTLLKILSKITSPTTGKVKVKGRIASLLEVGTGFHPELTGRENIYLNGAILGMRKHEIQAHLDEIIDFAGVDRYIDTPVKRYSSGMYVRLAFAVSAHLQNEILIIDEVLAVGDADFQKKCLGKMDQISKSEGRTVIFVSHILPSVKSLCNKAILLKNGCLNYTGNVNDTIGEYLSSVSNQLFYNSSSDILVLKSVKISNQVKQTTILDFGDDLIIELNLFSNKKIFTPSFWLSIESVYGPVYGANAIIDGFRPDFIEGEVKLKYKFEKIKLLSQEYTLHFGARDSDLNTLLMPSLIIGRFNVVTSLNEIGFLKTNDFFSGNFSPLLRDYSLQINDNIEYDFKLEKVNKNV